MSVKYTTLRRHTTDRVEALQSLADTLIHLVPLGLALERLTVDPDGLITLIVDNPIRADQLDHLGLREAPERAIATLEER